MANKHDLKYQLESVTAGASLSTHIGGRIPAGKTRFLTYLRVEHRIHIAEGSDVTGVSVLIGSVAGSDAAYTTISAGRMLGLFLNSVSMSNDSSAQELLDEHLLQQLPKNPDMGAPLLSKVGGASSWLMIGVPRSCAESTVLAAYFDE